MDCYCFSLVVPCWPLVRCHGPAAVVAPFKKLTIDSSGNGVLEFISLSCQSLISEALRLLLLLVGWQIRSVVLAFNLNDHLLHLLGLPSPLVFAHLLVSLEKLFIWFSIASKYSV